MRLTKKQLKRIIREEYTRLKRQGLIKESLYGLGGKSPVPPSNRQDLVFQMIDYLDQLDAETERAMDRYEMDDDRDPEAYFGLADFNDRDYVYANLRKNFPNATEEEIEEAMERF